MSPFKLFLLLLIPVFGVAGLWVYSIYYSVKHAPKAEMFYCPKHGEFLPDHVIKFMDLVEVVDEVDAQGNPIQSHISHGERYCPLCFHEGLKGPLA